MSTNDAGPVTTPRTFNQSVAEAMAVVPSITPAEARQRVASDPSTLVIDVRDAADITASGIIPGALAISYGALTIRQTMRCRQSGARRNWPTAPGPSL